VALVVFALLGAVAGIFIGRATTKATTSSTGALPSWQPLPRAPIDGRTFEGVVWTGTEMIVWGGVAHGRALSDGAAYTPATRTWRKIPTLPEGVRATAPGAVWTGQGAVFWAGNGLDGPAASAMYDPRTNAWRRLPIGPLGPREGYSSLWTGKELLVIGGSRGDAEATPAAAALNARTRTWRLLPAFDHLTFFGGPNGAVWNGREAFLTGSLSLCPQRGSACDQRRAIFVAFTPATNKVREIKLPAPSADFGADTASSLKPIAWTGSEVVFSAAVSGSVRIISYSPTTGTWKKGRPAPCYLGPQYTQTAWIGDRFVAACGADGLQIYNPVTDSWTWRTVTPGPSPLNSREGSAIVWTGTELIAWSGSVYKPFNPAPGDGASLKLTR
jgi:hypothetical protein